MAKQIISIFCKPIGLRTRVMVALLALMAITVFGLFLTNMKLVESGFREVEAKASYRYVRLIKESFAQRVENLETKAKDWANWTDLWEFAQSHDGNFAKRNLQTNVLRSLSINYMFIIDRRGNILFSRKFDVGQSKQAELSKTEVAALMSRVPGMDGKPKRRITSGIIQIDGTPLIVTSHELHRTDGKGEPRGAVIMARLIDQASIGRIAKTMQLELSLADDGWLNTGQVFKVEGTRKATISSNHIAVEIPIEALNRQPLTVRAKLERETHQQEAALLRLLFVGTSIEALFLTIGMWLLLTKLVLTRVDNLRTELASLKVWKANVDHVSEGYMDELGCLAKDINSLIAVKDAYATDLSNAHGDLIAYMAAIPFSLMLFDEDGHLIDANERALQLFATEPSAESEAMLWNLPLGRSRSELENLLSRTSARLAPETLPTVVIDTAEGSRIFDIVVNAIPMSGGTTRFLVSAMDVSEKHMLLRQLSNAQKLESIGQLAAGIAHEINTPTQFVSDNLKFLGEGVNGLIRMLSKIKEEANRLNGEGVACSLLGYIKDQESVEDSEYLIEQMPVAVSQSIDGLVRISTIVRAMKEFSHPAADAMSPSDLNRAIESTVSVSRNEWKYVAELVMDLDENLPLVECSINEINQVLLNLIVNAAHAIADVQKESGKLGTITIKTDSIDSNHVAITVSDTGAGIPEHIRSKIFDPFFTTKDVGKGTGQGLSIAHNVIVNHHRGLLQFDSAISRGTTFKITLPIYHSEPEASEAA